MAAFDYAGSELELFAQAVNWKRYWSSQITPFLGDRVLDVGAGIGATARALGQRDFRRWVALEPDPLLCQAMQQAAHLGELPAAMEIVNGTLVDLGAGRNFDTVLYVDVLEHIEDDRTELLNALRVLQPGGVLIIVAPAHGFLYTEFDRRIGHFRRYSRRSLLSILPPCLSIERLRYLDSVGMLASLANRMLLKSGSPTLAQIRLWDRWMVRTSMLVDPAFRHRVGKTIVCVARFGVLGDGNTDQGRPEIVQPVVGVKG